MSSATERNEAVRDILQSALRKLNGGAAKLCHSALHTEMQSIVASKTLGFRELLLVIILARLLDKNYRATVDLYGCSPRAMYEGPIRRFLEDNRVPCGQSGPLNIAKAIKKIDYAWASTRRPRENAEELLRVVETLESSEGEFAYSTLDCLLGLLLNYAVPRQAPRKHDTMHLQAAAMSGALKAMILKIPDRGNTAQRITGLLLHSYIAEVGSRYSVAGGEESVFATNTTSKKAGDLVVFKEPSRPWMVYEVTTKSFGIQRMSEAVQASARFADVSGKYPSETIVLCLPDNVPPDARVNSGGLLIGSAQYDGHEFTFVDVLHWIESIVTALPYEAKSSFYLKWEEILSQPNVRSEVRNGWYALMDAIKE